MIIIFLNIAITQTSTYSNIKFEIPKLKGDNYKVWRERVLLHSGSMDFDLASRKDEP